MAQTNAQAEAQYEKMTQTPVSRLVLALSGPTILSMMVTSIYNLADTYFVSAINTSASAAAGVVMGLMAILQAFGFMFGHGAGSNISRRLGSRRLEEARIYASTSFFDSIIAGLAVLVIGMVGMNPMLRMMGSTDTILPYARQYAFWILIAGPALTSSCVMNNILRYEGRAFFAMIGLTSGGILNIFGDFLLMRVWHLGVTGAGISTAVSQYISMFILLRPFLKGQTQSRISRRYYSGRGEVLKSILFVGMPSLCRQGLNSISMMFINNAAAVYGDAAVAAVSISNRIIMFLFCVALGIGQGLQPVSAFNFGARKYSRVREAVFFTLKLGMTLMAVLAVIGYQNAAALIGLFRKDPEVLAIGVPTLHWQCIMLWIMPVTMYCNMLFQSTGQGGKATFLAVLRSGMVLLPMLLILEHFFGLQGIEMARAWSEFVSALISIPFYVWFFRRLPQDGQEWLY
jgi:putative MATE family efflux protein